MSDRDLMVDIPNEAGWHIKSVDGLCSLISRGTAPVYVEQSRIKAIGQRCVSASGFIEDNSRHHSERAVSGVLQPQIGDVFLNSTGTGTIGRSVVFSSPGSFMVDGHVTVVRPRAGIADSRWLNSLFQAPYMQRHLERFCYAGSTNQLELSRTPLRLSSFPVPSFNEQEKISQVVVNLDTAIHETEAIIAKLKAVKQGLLHDLLTRGINANGELRPLPSNAPHLYKQSSLGWIPKSWDAIELNELVDPKRPVVYGILMPGYGWPGGVPVVKVKDIVNGQIRREGLLLTSPKIDREYSRSRLTAGDLLFTIRGTVGRTAFVPIELDSANITQDSARISIREVDPRFVRAYLQSPVANRFVSVHTLGVAVQGINLRDVRRIPMAKPLNDESKEISDRLDSIDQRIEGEVAAMKKLKIQKSGLMDDLLTGRVRVTPLLDAATQ